MTSSFIAELAAVGALAASADNSQPWRLNWTGQALEIGYAPRHSDTNVFTADSHATLLAVGGVAENLQMALTTNGVAGHWQWSSTAGPYGALALSNIQGKFHAPDGPLRRHTNRLAYRKDSLPADLLERTGACREGANRVSLLLDAGAKARLVRLVRTCSEARFCNHDLHKWLFGSLRATPEEVARGDGLDMASLGLPPGGKLMLKFMSDWNRMAVLNRLGAYKMLALSEVGLISAAPALLCVTGPADRRSVIDAGRLLTRVWTELNVAGVAVQPYYVVTDQINRLRDGTLAQGFATRIGAAEQEMHRLLGLPSDHTLHMILRVGYAAAAPVHSRRLPPAAVFTDSSEP